MRSFIFLILTAALFGAGFAAGRFWSAPRTGGAPGQLWTCGMHPQVIRDKPGICPICHMELTPLKPSGAASGPGAGSPATVGTVSIDPVLQQTMGVRTAAVRRGRLETRIRSLAIIREAQPRQRDFSLKVGGWVRKLHADTEGMHVRQGEPLFEIYSPALLAAQEELIAARRALERLPAGVDAIARREAEGLVETAREKLLLWDVAREDLSAIEREGRARANIIFRSPLHGHVVEKLVVEGSSVEPGMKIFRIVDHSVLWVDAQVYERQVPLISLGQTAEVGVEAFPGRSWKGTIAFVHPHVEETTRTAMARVQIDNPDLILKPGMYARVEIAAGLAEEAVLVPREAVIDTGVRRVAYITRDGGRFEPREVKTGAESEDGVIEILSGLSPGENVVTSGQFLIDAESRQQEAIQKLRSLPPPPSRQAPSLDLETRARLRPLAEALLGPYLDAASALAADDAAKAQAALSALTAASRAVAEAARGTPVEKLGAEVQAAVLSLDGRPIAEIRRSFKTGSEALISLLRAVPPSKDAGAGLFTVLCPMFPGEWIQRGDSVANPFYGREMHGCGETPRPLPVEEGR